MNKRMSVVDTTFAAFYARRAEAQSTEDCADSSDLSDDDFDESQYVELGEAFADFRLGEETSGATDGKTAQPNLRTKKGRRDYRTVLKEARKNTIFKMAMERANAEAKRLYWNKLWYTRPALPSSDKDGNIVPTAPYPIRFQGNWLWENTSGG